MATYTPDDDRHDLGGDGRPIRVGDLVTCDVPLCCGIRRASGSLAMMACELLRKTRSGRVEHAGIATTVECGVVSVLWPDGDVWNVPAKLLRSEVVGIERRRNARMDVES